jgi:hypothetical protein
MSLAPRTMKMISGLLLCLGFFCCAGTSPRLGSLMTFEMEDQFRHSHSHADFKGRVLVVIGSDREGAPAAENWGKALSQALKPERDAGRLNLIGLSTLKGVPFFLKDYVRGKFSQNAGEWALLDWKGLFADSYGFVAGNANVLVFDKEGVLVHQAHFSECLPDQVLSLTAIIRSRIDGPPPVLEYVIPPGLTGPLAGTRPLNEDFAGTPVCTILSTSSGEVFATGSLPTG